MIIEHVKITNVNPAKYNPRKITDLELAGLKESIKKFGFVEPLIVNKKTGTLCGGHQRLKAAELLGMESVPVTYVDLSELEEKALNVALNSGAIQGKFDVDILPGLLTELNIELPDLSKSLRLDVLGADLKLDFSLGNNEGLTDDDAVPEVGEKVKTKLGDVWLLGDHRVMCGDATNKECVDLLMNGEKADMVFTDPPYNQSKSGGGMADKRPGWSKHKDNGLSDFDPTRFLAVMSALEAPTAYIFCNKDLLKSYFNWIDSQERSWNLLAMRKKNPIPMKNNTFLADVEWLVFTRGKGAIFNNDLEYDYYRRVFDTQVRASEFGHPTEKRVFVPERFIKISSSSGGKVLDLFLGAGSTLIACEKTNRKCYGMELDPHYCDVIIKRWQDFTGKKAIRESDKANWDDLI